MPVLTIDDPEVYALARELSARTGRSMADVVRETLRERLRQAGPVLSDEDVVERVVELAN